MTRRGSPARAVGLGNPLSEYPNPSAGSSSSDGQSMTRSPAGNHPCGLSPVIVVPRGTFAPPRGSDGHRYASESGDGDKAPSCEFVSCGTFRPLPELDSQDLVGQRRPLQLGRPPRSLTILFHVERVDPGETKGRSRPLNGVLNLNVERPHRGICSTWNTFGSGGGQERTSQDIRTDEGRCLTRRSILFHVKQFAYATCVVVDFAA